MTPDIDVVQRANHFGDKFFCTMIDCQHPERFLRIPLAVLLDCLINRTTHPPARHHNLQFQIRAILAIAINVCKLVYSPAFTPELTFKLTYKLRLTGVINGVVN
ncbi:MAG: hypothetical protein CMQ11_07810 [Gammaproteobacteria bacterium]|nr:hypothetical protein [Gammaproteobacteria bacterium]